MTLPPNVTLPPETPICPAPVPWLRIATVSCASRPVTVSVPALKLLSASVKVTSAAMICGAGILEKRDRRGEAGQGGNRVRHLLVLRVVRGQKPSCELRPPPPRSPHWSSRGMPVFPLRFAGKSLAAWALAKPSAALFEADELRHGLDVACRMLRSTAEFEHETRAASQCRLPMAFIAREHWSARHPETILRGGGAGRESKTSGATNRCNLHSSPVH